MPKMEELFMDIVFSAYPFVLTAILWPLVVMIKLFPKVSQWWFANFYSVLMNANKDGFDDFKFEFFKSLYGDQSGQLVSCDAELRSQGRFRLLEVGAGPGTNFKYYPRNLSLIALDVNDHFRKYFDANLEETNTTKCSSESNNNVNNNQFKNEKESKIELEKFIISRAEDMSMIEDSSVDAVVATHVLCSVDSPEKVLSEINRVLKDGGKYYMMEHVGHHDKWMHVLQSAIKPFWAIFNGGCDLQRESLAAIKKSAFKNTDSVKYGLLRPLPFPVVPNITGILIK